MFYNTKLKLKTFRIVCQVPNQYVCGWARIWTKAHLCMHYSKTLVSPDTLTFGGPSPCSFKYVQINSPFQTVFIYYHMYITVFIYHCDLLIHTWKSVINLVMPLKQCCSFLAVLQFSSFPSLLFQGANISHYSCGTYYLDPGAWEWIRGFYSFHLGGLDRPSQLTQNLIFNGIFAS